MTRSTRLLAFFTSMCLSAPLRAEALFLRGNSNGDTKIDIADPIHTLTYLFLGGSHPECLDAADSNDSGGLDISDPVYTLGYLFLGGPEPPAPGPDVPGPDPSGDPLDCPGPTALVLEVIELRDGDGNGSMDSALLVMSEAIDTLELPPPGSFALAWTPAGGAPEVLAGSEISASGHQIEVRFGSGIGKTDIQDVELRIAAPAPVRPASGGPAVDLGPRILTEDSVGPTGRPVLIDKAQPVLIGVSMTDTDGDGAPDQLQFQFSEDVHFSAGHGVAIGGIIDAPSALTVPAGATLSLRVDSGPPVTVTFDSASTGAEAIVAELAVLLAQPAPTGLGEAAPAVEFQNGRFILRSRSTGAASAVDITGGTAAALLGFGGAHLERPGRDSDEPEIEDFLVFSSSGLDLLGGMTDQDIAIDGNRLSIRIAPVPAGEEVLYFIADDLDRSFLSDEVGNDAPVISNVQVNDGSLSGELIRIRDRDEADDGAVHYHPGVVPFRWGHILINQTAVQDVRIDLVSVTGATDLHFLEPAELLDQEPAADLFPSVPMPDGIEVVGISADLEFTLRVTLTLDRAAIPIQIVTDSAGRISREFRVEIDNVAPRAELAAPVMVAAPGATVILDGSASRDPNGNDLRSASGAIVEWTIESPSGARTHRGNSLPAISSTELGAHRITLTVTDPGGAVSEPAEGILIVTGTGTSQVPTADAGLDRVVRRVNTVVTLDGSASYDPDTAVKKFTWTQVGGPLAVLGGTSSVNPTFTPTVPGTYVFELVVSDSNGSRPSAPDTVTVIVIDDQATTPRRPPAARARVVGSPISSVPQVLDELVVKGDLSVGTGTLDLHWSQVRGVPVTFTTTGDELRFRPVFPSTYVFELVVTDSTGLTSLPARVVVPVQPRGSGDKGNNVNWLFGSDGRVTLGGTLTDSSGTPVPGARFLFVPKLGPPVVLADEGPGRASFVPPHSGVYEFDVLAVTPEGVTFTSEIEAPVSLPGNPLPVAVLEVTPGMTSVQLDGSASTPAGLSFHFIQEDGLPTVLDPVGGDVVTFVPVIPGSYEFELVVIDPARRLRSARARSGPVMLDTGAPDQPVLTSSTPASPSSDETPVVHGTAEPGATVEIHSGCGGPLLGTGAADSSGAFSITVAVPENATTGLRAFAVDEAGNRSLCSSSFIAYVEDSLGPGAPDVTSTIPASPSSDETPIVHGTAEPGATVQIRSDCIGPVLGSGTADASGAFTIEATVPENTLTVLRAFAIDAAGNPSTCSSSFIAYIEDSVAPAPPDVTETSPHSPSSDESITVEGTAEPGSTVEVYSGLACGGSLLGSAVAGDFGAFAVSVTVQENATTRLQARCIDRAGNASACSSNVVLYLEDSLAPAAPHVIGTSPPSPSNDETIAVEGTAEPGATVQVFAAPGCDGSPLASAVALASGVFAVPVTVSENAITRLHARAIDAAGNASACSSSFSVFVEDSIPPDPAVITGTTPPSPSSSTTFQVSGTAEALATVRLHTSASCAGSPAATGAVSAAGTFSVPITIAPDAVTPIRVTLRDAAGNVSPCPPAGFAIENDLPPGASLTPPGTDLRGCIPIEYTLRDTTSDPADVVVEFRLAGSPDFERATLGISSSSGTPSEGVYGLSTSPGGTAHHFVWNSQADLGPNPAAGVTLRIRPISRIDGTDGASAMVSGLDIENGLELATPLDVTSTDPRAVEAADLDRDGRLDLVAANGSTATVTVHLQDPVSLGFSALPPVAAGLEPSSLAVADLDRDGNLDVAVANHGDSSISVLFGDGTGHLAAGLPPLGPCPGVADVRAADLDRDGRVDLATANETSGEVSVFLQTAAGFGPPATRVTGSGAASLAIGDIDRDGRPDIVVANQISSTVSFLRQDPATPGSFLSAANTPGSGPRCVSAADLDDDGKLDLVTANPSAGGVSVFRGRGDGTLEPRLDVSTGSGSAPLSVAVADADGDGLLDVAVAASGSGDLLVLPQEGGAGIAFDPPVSRAAGASFIVRVLPDYDQDGDIDFVVASSSSGTISLVGNTQVPRCEVTVDAGTSLEAGPSPESLAIGDFDRDGHLDLVVVDPPGSAVRLLDGAGNGVTFTGSTWPAGGDARTIVVVDLAADGTDDPIAATPSSSSIQVLPALPPGVGPPVAHAVGSNPVSLAALDANLDGLPDIAVANQGSNDVTILLGDATGGFAPAPGSPIAVSAGPVSVAAGDVDGDSRPDLLVACADAGAVVYLRGSGGGEFVTAGSAPVAGRPVRIAVGDVNGDGKADFCTANELGGTVTIRLGNSSGVFVDAAGSPISVGGSPSSVAVGDLDGDGRLDVVVAIAEAGHDRVVVFEEDDAGLAAASATRTGSGPSAIAIGDLNGDGRLDLAVGHTGAGGAQVFRGKGDGSFASVHDFDASIGVRPVATGDFDRDGRTDLVIGDPDGDSFSLHIGDGRGGFSLPQTFAAGDRPSSIAVGDLNRDGLQDLVVANSGSSTFTVHLAGSAGGFAPAVPFPTVDRPHAVTLGDVDRDGDLDVVVSVPAARLVSVHRGDGAGSFVAPSHTAAGVQPSGLALGDLDRDGILDLVAVDPAVSIVRVFKGDGTGAFLFLGTFGVGLEPTGVALGDLDTDGRLDLAVTNRGSHEITVRHGDGLGGFGSSSSIPTGNGPASVSIADVTGDGKSDILAATDDGIITVHVQGGPLGYLPPVKIVAAVAADGEPLASGSTIRNNTGGCAVARFEHLGGPAVQRLAGLAAMMIPLGIIAFLKRREKRRRGCGPGSSTS